MLAWGAPSAWAATLAALLALCLVCGPAGAGPLQAGGDTRDIAATPDVHFHGPVVIHPGDGGNVSFSLTNRYNQSMGSVQVELTFRVGGEWLTAQPLNTSDPNVPAFVPSTPLPRELAPNETMRVEAPFTTTARTVAGVYLVSLVVRFSYTNATGAQVSARLVSLGSVDTADRGKVNMADYNGTLDRLSRPSDAVDGIVPDSSIEVDDGGASTLWWWAAGFGVAVMAAGAAYGLRLSRRPHKSRR